MNNYELLLNGQCQHYTYEVLSDLITFYYDLCVDFH